MNPPALVLPCEAEFQRGSEAFHRREIVKALFFFNNAELTGYNADECASARWYCWMLLGKYEEAWLESDAIAERGSADVHRLWDQNDFAGKHLVIRCLHGLGDAIQFVRYAALLSDRAASVTVETHAELVSLFSGLEYLDRVVSWADGSSKNLTGWNQQIEVMELPRAFRTSLETVPSQVPYLWVNAAAILHSRSMLRGRDGALRVGLMWRSSEWNPARSLSAVELAPVALIRDISFYSFQRGPGRAELDSLRQYADVHDTADHSNEITETAADLMNMDLLITVDTMAAHLAGALGRPVWLMLPFQGDWRWMLDTSSSPWYPTMTIYRQNHPGDWSSVVERIADDLRVLEGVPRSNL